MPYVLAEETATAQLWPQLVGVALLFLAVILLGGLVLNVNKMLRRLTSIRSTLEAARETGTTAQLGEALVQLQSMAVSLDRVALRCDAIESGLAESRASGTGTGEAGLADAVRSLREGIEQLRVPVVEIRDQIGKSELERLEDEVKRTLYSMGYDQVVIRTDLATIGAGEGKAQVEVSRGGVKSKGYVLLRGGSAVETRFSPTYEMFP